MPSSWNKKTQSERYREYKEQAERDIQVIISSSESLASSKVFQSSMLTDLQGLTEKNLRQLAARSKWNPLRIEIPTLQSDMNKASYNLDVVKTLDSHYPCRRVHARELVISPDVVGKSRAVIHSAALLREEQGEIPVVVKFFSGEFIPLEKWHLNESKFHDFVLERDNYE